MEANLRGSCRVRCYRLPECIEPNPYRALSIGLFEMLTKRLGKNPITKEPNLFLFKIQ
jgi:hypothetical protein